jgi:hypothetical protein
MCVAPQEFASGSVRHEPFDTLEYLVEVESVAAFRTFVRGFSLESG